jgi:hypothetical protein
MAHPDAVTNTRSRSVATTAATAVVFAAAGAASGALSSLIFALVHAIVISDIWNTAVVLVAAGALCGASIGWSYGRLFEPSVRSWLAYCGGYVMMLGLLGAVSVALFEPVTTMAALLATDGPPSELIEAALPVTILYTLGAALVLAWLVGRPWSAFATILLTCGILVALLGLNVSVIGLVEIPAGSLYLVVEMFGLVLLLAGTFAAVFLALMRHRLRATT